MKTQQIFATGLLTVIAFGSLTFMPASADSLEASAKAGDAPAIVLAGTETPQHLVWDMTYGDLAPSAGEEPAAPSENTDVSDLSMA